jgi:hypothetical protein
MFGIASFSQAPFSSLAGRQGEEWTPTPFSTDTWTPVSASSDTWTTISPSSDTWLRQG